MILEVEEWVSVCGMLSYIECIFCGISLSLIPIFVFLCGRVTWGSRYLNP